VLYNAACLVRGRLGPTIFATILSGTSLRPPQGAERINVPLTNPVGQSGSGTICHFLYNKVQT